MGFGEYLHNGQKNILSATREDIHIYIEQKKKAKGRNDKNTASIIASLRMFYIFINNDNIIHKHKNPLDLLSLKEIKLLFFHIEEGNYYSLRDKTIFSLMYYQGLRIHNITKMMMYNMDLEHGYINDKTNKRNIIIKIKKEPMRLLSLYCESARIIRTKKKNILLFINSKGKKLSDNNIIGRLKSYVQKAGIPKYINENTLKDSRVMHMAETGIDLKTINDFIECDN